MKKLSLFAIIFVFLFCIFLTGCEQTTYYYSADTISYYSTYEKQNTSSEEKEETLSAKVPKTEEILGTYYVTGLDGAGEAMGWKIYVQKHNGKLVMQAFENGTPYGDISEGEFKNLKSSYNESSGIFKQNFENETFGSIFEAQFVLDGSNRIKIGVTRRSQIKGSFEYINAIKATGYKEVD